MKKRQLWLLAVPLLITPFASGVGEKKGDLDQVQGTWVVVSVEAEGKPLPEDQGGTFAKKVELAVTGNKVAVKIPPELLQGKEAPTISFTIDPKARPTAVDLKVRERDSVYDYKGIYLLEGDKLTLCIGVGENAERPTDFTAKDNSKRMLGVFKRKGK